MKKLIILASVFLASSVFLACSDDEATRCINSGECPLPEVCVPLETDDEGNIVRGQCGIECRIDTDCESEKFCVESVCQSADRPCREQADCEPFGRTCIAGILRCVQRCTPSLPCPMGTYCEGGYCLPEGIDATLVSVDIPDSSLPMTDQSVAPLRDADVRPPEPTDMALNRIDMMRPQPDMAIVDQRIPPDIDMETGPVAGAYGSPCARAADCSNDICVPNVYRQDGDSIGICSSRCNRAADCPGLDSCTTIQDPNGQTIQVCAPNETGQGCTDNAVGAQCPYHNICNTPPNPFPQEVPVENQCASECTTSSDCPSGYRCDLVSVGANNALICTPDIDIRTCAGSNEFCGGVCPNTSSSNEADVAHCVGFGGAARLCTCECNSSNDCPQGFACDAVSDLPFALTSGRAGICFPIAGYRCDGTVNACMSAACSVVATAPSRAVCTSPCRTSNDCPTGYTCDIDTRLSARVCRPQE